VRAARPAVRINPGFKQQLQVFDSKLQKKREFYQDAKAKEQVFLELKRS
jgi:hypothetical protein